MTALRLLAIAPYFLFLFLILSPIAAVAYGLAAVAATVWANARQGWKDRR